MKRIISLILIAVMAFGLCACGSGGKTAEVKKDDAEATPMPEFVYTSKYNQLGTGLYSGYYMSCFDDSGIYATASECVGSLADNPDVEIDYVGQYDVTESRLYHISYDGKIEKLNAYVPVPTPEKPEGEVYDYYSFSSLSSVCVLSDGNLAVVEDTYENWVDLPNITWQDESYSDHSFYNTHYYLRVLDRTGAEISRVEIPMDFENSVNPGYMSVYGVTDSQDNILGFYTEYDENTGETTLNEVRAYDKDANLMYTVPVGANEYFSGAYNLKDGVTYFSLWADEGMVLKALDESAHKLSAPVPIPDSVDSIYPSGGDYDFYYLSGNNVYGFTFGAEDGEKLYSFADVDVDSGNAWNMAVDAEGSMYFVENVYDAGSESYDVGISKISRVASADLPAKQHIRFAVQYLDWMVQTEVVRFNRTHPDYHIDIINYAEYNNEDDWSAGLTKLKTELLSGNIPDIISLNQMPVTQLANKGYLEDLYPYIDADKELNRSDFFENVLKATEKNGKLIMTIPFFSVSTVMGPTEIVGENDNWTYDDFKRTMALMGDECSAFDVYTDRYTILQTCLALDMADFVNWETGKVDFNNDEFIDLLNFAKQFPETINYDDIGMDDSSETRIAERRQLLERVNLYDAYSLLNEQAMFGDTPTTFVGYPSNNGNGTALSVSEGLAMSATSEYKDVIWDFLRVFFTRSYIKQYQDTGYGISTRRDVFEEGLESIMTVRYEKDEHGNYKLDEDGDKIPVRRVSFGETYADVSVNAFYALSREQGERFVSLIEGVDRLADYDQSIISIVEEESAAFFSGQKSAEEVAKLVQSKANIYVNEQR